MASATDGSGATTDPPIQDQAPTDHKPLVLDRIWAFGAADVVDESTKPGLSESAVVHGQNEAVMRSLMPEIRGRVDCAYLDPPYNTGHRSKRGRKRKRADAEDPGAVDAWAYDDAASHEKWSETMRSCLLLVRELLSLTGVVFLSIGDREVHRLRLILDEVFGEACFVAQLVLVCNPKGRGQGKYFSTVHEYCLVYSKSVLPKGSFSVPKTSEEIARHYPKVGADDRQYRLMNLRNTHREFTRATRPNLWYPLWVREAGEGDDGAGDVSVSEVVDGATWREVWPIWPDGTHGCWTWGRNLAEKQSGLLVGRETRGNWSVYRRSYATDADGAPASKNLFSVLSDTAFRTECGQADLARLFPGSSKRDFPAPKSVAFVRALLETVCVRKKDALVFDCFGGSGTTGHAVLALNAADGGSRRFLLVEREDYAETLTAERLRRVGAELGGEFSFYRGVI